MMDGGRWAFNIQDNTFVSIDDAHPLETIRFTNDHTQTKLNARYDK